MQRRCVGYTVMMVVLVRWLVLSTMMQMIQTIAANRHQTGDGRRYTNCRCHRIVHIVMIVQVICCRAIAAAGHEVLQAQAVRIAHTLDASFHFIVCFLSLLLLEQLVFFNDFFAEVIVDSAHDRLRLYLLFRSRILEFAHRVLCQLLWK